MTRVRLAGSALLRPGFSSFAVTARPLTDAELARSAVVTVHLREAPGADSVAVALARQQHTPVQSRRYLSAAALAAEHGSSIDDLHAVTRWAARSGLRARRGPASATTLELSGSLGALARAFDVTLEHRGERDAITGARRSFRDHREELSVPADLDGVVTAVLGLSDRPAARPRLAMLPRGNRGACFYTPEELARIYDFPVLDQGVPGCGSPLASRSWAARYIAQTSLPSPLATLVCESSRRRSRAGDRRRTHSVRTRRWPSTGR